MSISMEPSIVRQQNSIGVALALTFLSILSARDGAQNVISGTTLKTTCVQIVGAMDPKDIYPGMRFLYYEKRSLRIYTSLDGLEYIGTILALRGPVIGKPGACSYTVKWDWQDQEDEERVGAVDSENIMPLFEPIPYRPCGSCERPAYLSTQDYLCVSCRKTIDS